MQPRILHAGHVRTVLDGVINQMIGEQKAAEELDINWTSALYSPAEADGSVCVNHNGRNSWFNFKNSYYKWLGEQSNNYDAILLRYSMGDPLQLRFMKNAQIPIFTMHHTLELKELSTNTSRAGKLKLLTETLVGPSTLKLSKGFVGMTDETAVYQTSRSGSKSTPTIRYSNGAHYEEKSAVAREPNREVPEFLFVASQFAPWTGFDLIYEAAQKTNRPFKLHVVGLLNDELSAMATNDPRFILHGKLKFHEIAAIMKHCSVGLGSFALDRYNMTEGGTLKIREYLRSGLPVYSGYKDVFENDFPYYINEKPNFDSLLEFTKQMENISPELISESARPFIDKNVMLSDIYSSLCEHL